MMIILLILFLFINKSQSLEWNCTAKNKHPGFSNDHIYEQCTITVEYISIEQEKHICITHSLSIKALPSLSFSSNYAMHTFKINSCQLLTLNQLPFLLPSSVEKLDLSYNLLSTFTLSFPLPSYIKYLYLDHNPNLIDINFGHQYVQQRLISLSLRHNKNIKISSLPVNLTQLDLTNSNLLQSSILSLLKTLPKLTHLSLANNQLKQLPILDQRIQLEYLNLSNNHLTFVEDRWLHKSLKILDIKFNQIESLEFFKEIWKINQTLRYNKYDQTMNDHILQLSLFGNPLICDCWLGSILDSFLINITDLSLLECNSYSIMNISHDDLQCSYSRHCASDCSCCDFEACDCHFVCPSECLCLYDIFWSNHIVQCQQRNLSEIHIHLPETVTELNYEANNIEHLESFSFIGKNLLIKLNLAKNNIKTLTNDTFCGAVNLYEINLSYNRNLMNILSNIDELFSCLKYLEYIILSKEQIHQDEQISYGWTIDSDNDLVRLKRRTQQFSPVSSSAGNLYTLPISTNIYPLFQSKAQPTTIFSISHENSFISSSFIHHNQTLIITIFFLLLFVLLFLLILISLAICRRKLREHLITVELQRQRSHPYYYHTDIRPPSIKIPNSNGNIGINDSLYEQLPSLSSDSEQPFLYNDNKLISTNAPNLPPYPPTFHHYQCCQATNSHEYQYGRNPSTTTTTCYSSSNSQQHSCPAVLVLRNQSFYPNHHEYSCELQQCLFTHQQERNSIVCCNSETDFASTTLCQCNSHMQNIDTCIYPNVHK